MKGAYLFINLAVISIPFLFSWHPKWKFYSTWKAFWPACLLTAAPFLVWDVWFASSGVWGFNPDYLLGPHLLGLPLEEWLFFVCIPYSCVFTFFVLSKRPVQARPFMRVIIGVLLAVSLTTMIAFNDRLYTLICSAGLSVWLMWMIVNSPTWLPTLMKSLALLSIPFVLTNGLLTGLDFWTYPILNLIPDTVSPSIVWYNNLENMGLRLWSIPLDDFFYATLLIGGNVTMYEFFRSNSLKRK